MIHFIQWSDQAFRELEALPEPLAFEIIRKTDLLSPFPELGTSLGARSQQLRGFRQLIIDRNWRVIYETDQANSSVWVLAIQNCRQKLPSKQSLRKRKDTT